MSKGYTRWHVASTLLVHPKNTKEMSSQQNTNSAPSPDEVVPSIEVNPSSPDTGDDNNQSSSNPSQPSRSPFPTTSTASSSSSSTNVTGFTNVPDRKPTSTSMARASSTSSSVQHANSIFSTTSGPRPPSRSNSPPPPRRTNFSVEHGRQDEARFTSDDVDSEAETDICDSDGPWEERDFERVQEYCLDERDDDEREGS
ncbi:hypothetical protein DOTSEDRAFT_29359 [Dothistroma septosporum NZE10]|uniref:Uncharacterized protein n=1 Tax=Dothistroma septosporum (strain NZE10 / CBS 128990) TaxID=675120 RepID=N1PDL3_DOTSN|nr:hypothetical protein DOTSEDRAFT_29359 [Dothistroma septosporum NZE10]